jgi:photosystem II stability/assembly factor-like uncharacterized protein
MILIGTDDGIYRWFEGAGWPVFHSLQHHAITALAAPGAGVLAALDRKGRVFETVDNGLSWRTIPLAEGASNPSAIAVGGEPAMVVLATGVGGLQRRRVGEAIPQSREEVVAVKPGFATPLLHQAKTLTRTASTLLARRQPTEYVDLPTARRAGWSQLGPFGGGSATKSVDVRVLALGYDAATPWYAAVRGRGLWRSTDAGITWQQCPGLTAEVYAVRTVPKQPDKVFVGSSDGCFVSTDGGQSWENRSEGFHSGRHVSAIEVKPGAPDTLLASAGPFAPDQAGASPVAGAGYSLFESSNGGKSWSHVKRGHPEVMESDAIIDIRYDPAAPDNIVVAQTSGELWVTRNDGAYWGPLARQIEKARVLAAVV